jgi:glucose-6-phosphate isomerase
MIKKNRRKMLMIKADLTGAMTFIDEQEISTEEGKKLLDSLYGGQIGCGGSGWLRLIEEYGESVSGTIKDAAFRIAGDSAALIVIGIGGSYLGARAALDFIKSPSYNLLNKNTPDIYFVGNNLSGDYLEQVIALISGRDFSVNYVSKSGGTIEPSIAFRVFKSLLTAKYGEDGAKKRIYITTDPSQGKLRELTSREGYASFPIPEDIGGRYSVLSAVGLLPAAVAGIDIDDMMAGAREMMDKSEADALNYAAARQALYRRGKKIELLTCFEPCFHFMGEWWKQLFGESEGKDGLGIFPAFADYTTDLHSLGQYIQEGERTIQETFVTIDKPRSKLRIPTDGSLDDGLTTLSGREILTVNNAASKAVKKAHIDGGVPVLELHVPDISARSFGALVQFFEMSCAVSALLMKVNPFDQPGVEAYKKNLYAILGLKK